MGLCRDDYGKSLHLREIARESGSDVKAVQWTREVMRTGWARIIEWGRGEMRFDSCVC